MKWWDCKLAGLISEREERLGFDAEVPLIILLVPSPSSAIWLWDLGRPLTSLSQFLHPLKGGPWNPHGVPRWLSGRESACQCGRHRNPGFDPWVRKIPWRRKWWPIPVFLPGESHGQRSLAGYSPWSCKELNTMEQLGTAQHSCCIALQYVSFRCPT